MKKTRTKKKTSLKKVLLKSKKKARKKVAAKSNLKLQLKTKSKLKKKPPSADIAHRPGHRRLNKSDEFAKHNGPKVHLQESAVNALANSDIIKKHNSRHRRIISGAAIGKTGRIIIKE